MGFSILLADFNRIGLSMLVYPLHSKRNDRSTCLANKTNYNHCLPRKVTLIEVCPEVIPCVAALSGVMAA